MRHNPASGAIVIMLRQLKMHGMAHAIGELTEQGSTAFEAAIPILSQLLKAETAEREVRSVAYQLKTARFPAYRDLNGFDFSSSEATLYNWKAKYGGMDVSDAKRLKALEDENAKLKKLLADQMLEASALRELLSKKW